MEKSPLSAAALAALAVFGAPSAAALGASRVFQVIYGADLRQEVFEARAPIRKLARSTVALFPAASVRIAGKEAILQTDPFDQVDGVALVPGERFRGQPKGSFCSGALVGPDVVMTAGHCLDSPEDCKETKFVFDFALSKEGADATKVPAGSVFGCAALLGKQELGQKAIPDVITRAFGLPPARDADWALVRLDREVKDRAPLALSRKPLAKDARVFAIGYPKGLPAKVTEPAKRLSDPEGLPDLFMAHLDTYKGNSGSPVFNADTYEIEGILVTGEPDFETAPFCRAPRCLVLWGATLCEPPPGPEKRSVVIPEDDPRAETATKVQSILRDIEKALDDERGWFDRLPRK